MSCDPNDLIKAARCFSCIPGLAAQWVKDYLLCQLSGRVLIVPDATLTTFTLTNDTNYVGLVFPNLVSISGALTITNNTKLRWIAAPKLVSLPTGTDTGNNLILVNFSMPAIATSGGFTMGTNYDLLNFSLPSLVSSGGGGITFEQKGAVQNVSLPLWTPTNGTVIDFSQCALTPDSVNHILARCVANPAFVGPSIVDLGGGTNAKPSGQGIADKATLVARGVNISTN